MRARDWHRLADKIRKRRAELDLSQQALADAAKVSLRTIPNLEGGQPAKDRTLARIERALGWAPGSIDTILDVEGGEPSPLAAEPALESTQGVDDPVALILDADLDELIDMCRTVEADPKYGIAGAEAWLLRALKLRDAAQRRKEDTKRSAS